LLAVRDRTLLSPSLDLLPRAAGPVRDLARLQPDVMRPQDEQLTVASTLVRKSH